MSWVIKPDYRSLFLQLRLLADSAGDNRSLVALAAQFERDADDGLPELLASVRRHSHVRNEEGEKNG